MNKSPLFEARQALLELTKEGRHGISLKVCPMPGCESNFVFSDGVYTICHKGHVCSEQEGDFLCATGVEKYIFQLLNHKWRHEVQKQDKEDKYTPSEIYKIRLIQTMEPTTALYCGAVGETLAGPRECAERAENNEPITAYFLYPEYGDQGEDEIESFHLCCETFEFVDPILQRQFEKLISEKNP